MIRALTLGRWRRLTGADRRESGQIMLLALAFAALALALVLVLASASAVHIERKQLLALADAAALDAADAVDLAAFYGDTVLPGDAADPRAGAGLVPLTDRTVRDAVQSHLAASPAAAGVSAVRVGEPTGTPDGVTAEVTLTAIARPPFIPWALVGWSDGIALRATSTARAGQVG